MTEQNSRLRDEPHFRHSRQKRVGFVFCFFFYLLDFQFGGVEVMLYFLCVLCGFLGFCPLLGKALLRLPGKSNRTPTLRNTAVPTQSLRACACVHFEGYNIAQTNTKNSHFLDV